MIYKAVQIAGVISQPGRAQGRGKRRVPQPTPVEAVAREANLDPGCILVPETARSVSMHWLGPLSLHEIVC